MTRAEKSAAKKLDLQISAAYHEACDGVQIDIFDIGRVFDEGKKALVEGRDLKTALREFVEGIRKN